MEYQAVGLIQDFGKKEDEAQSFRLLQCGDPKGKEML